MNPVPELDYIFHPRTAAVTGGAKGAAEFFLRDLKNKGFKGDIYVINRNEAEVQGLKSYPSVKDIPGPLDYIIVAIPAKNTPEFLRECVEKKVKVVHLFTAGFSELGTEEGRRLEKEVAEIAKKGGLRIVGPNCMGIYCPSTGLHLSEDLQTESGPLGLICQSGTVSTYLSRIAPLRGAAISKAVSYGNACDLDESDFLDYLADDSETEVIGAYIEGIKDGKRFKKALEKAAKAKPTIILKGGRTEVGAKLAASHTGVLASSMKAWNALVKQSGAIPVESIDEIIDLALMFIYSKPIKGRNIGMIGIGGGVSVLATDYFGNLNLSFPPLPDEVKAQLQSLTATVAGTIYNNPVDTPLFFFNPDAFSQVLEVFDQWGEIDMLLLHLGYDVLGGSRDNMDDIFEVLLKGAKTVEKPVSLLLNYVSFPQSYADYIADQRKAFKEGIPSFSIMESAAKAIDRFITYHENKP